MSSPRIFNQGHLKFSVIYSQLLFYTDAFAKVALPIFKEIHGKDSDKYCRLQVSDNSQIILLNGVRNYGTWIKKNLMAS